MGREQKVLTGENSMKRIKTILALSVLLSISLCLSGCGCIPKNIRANMITKYMENKYTDDHFELKKWRGCGGAGGFPPNTEAYYASEKCPYKDIRAVYVADTNKYYDNYLGVKYSKQLDEYIENYAKTLFPGHNVKIGTISDESSLNIKVNDLPPDTSFEEYLKKCGESIIIYCEYDPEELSENRDEIEKRVLESIKNLEMHPRVFLIDFVNDGDKKNSDGNTFEHLSISFVFDEDHNNTSNTIEDIKWRK